MAENGGALAHAAGRVEHLAEHFDTPVQQFEASKLGMWLFLATEVLLFGGLFCLYTILRTHYTEAFHWGHRFLDLHWGTLNTLVLLTSSLTVAWGVNCAQKGQNRRLVVALVLTLLFGCAFMGVKYIEYSAKVKHGLLWGRHFKPDPHYVAARLGVALPEKKEEARKGPDPERGKKLFLGTCASCHGQKGQGLPGQGANLRTSEFVAGKSDKELLAFVKVGRRPWDPASKLKLDMPPRGGNPMLKDQDLEDIISYIRILQKEAKAAGEGQAKPGAQAAAQPQAPALEIPRSAIAPPPEGPQGLKPSPGAPDPEKLLQPPPKTHFFFALYFLMTGLHGLHVLAGLVVITILLIMALRKRFSPQYFTPVEVGGLYWHLVDVIWIYLFPLFYLIS